MADVFSKQKRSEVMSRIRSKNTKPELELAKFLKKNGIPYKRYPRLFGSPDLLLPTSKTVVFVDGCFWHACKRCFKQPKTNKGFWKDKIRRNKSRDRKVSRELGGMGYRVVRIFECQLEKGLKRPEKLIRRFKQEV